MFVGRAVLRELMGIPWLVLETWQSRHVRHSTPVVLMLQQRNMAQRSELYFVRHVSVDALVIRRSVYYHHSSSVN